MSLVHPVVLVVDAADICGLVKDVLEPEGYTVEAVRDGESALTRLRFGRVDLLLADLMLPDISGLELCRQARTRPELRALPIILFSAAPGSCWREQSIAAGASDYLPKPFDVDKLLDRVQAQVLLPAGA